MSNYLPLIKSNSKCITLSCKQLNDFPKVLCQCAFLESIDIKSNNLKVLPKELTNLRNLKCLNLGNNLFEDLPECFCQLHQMKKLHLFNNRIRNLDSKILCSMFNLQLLNLNHNSLKELPPEIANLRNLTCLSIDNNELTFLPEEICLLDQLRELYMASNKLISIPLEIGQLTNLHKLVIPKNKIRELPESIAKLYKLKILDVAGNELRIFPTQINNLPLRELYYEENPLLKQIPVQSVQEEEILSLREMCARYIMKQLKTRNSLLRRLIKHFPEARDILSQCSQCAICGESFLNTWLECVKFVDASKTINISNRVSNVTIPVRALLCSYKCFNTRGHEYYGVAFL